MPTYEYVCPVCNLAFERRMSLSQHSPEVTCPECGGTAKQRVGAGVSVITSRRAPKMISSGSSEQCAGRPTCGEESPCCERGVACDGGHD